MKRLLLIFGLLCVYSTMWAAFDPTRDPAPEVKPENIHKVQTAEGEAYPEFVTSNIGIQYHWYLYNESTAKFVYRGTSNGSTNNKHTPRTNGKYMCVVAGATENISELFLLNYNEPEPEPAPEPTPTPENKPTLKEISPCEQDTITLSVNEDGDKLVWCMVEDGVEKPIPDAFDEAQKKVYCSKIGVNKSLHLRHKAMKYGAIKLENNLIDNGDFSDASSTAGHYNGFSSSYDFYPLNGSFNPKVPSNDGTIVTYPGYYRLTIKGLNGILLPDPVKGGDYFLECDGDSNADAIAYSAKIKSPIVKGESYQFSYMAATTCTADPAYDQEYGKITFWLVLYDNSGNVIEEHKLLPENEIDNKEWKTFGEGVYWTATRDCDHAEIHLTNAATSFGANDFGLDNIMFQHCEVEGEVKQEDFIITPVDCSVKEVVNVTIEEAEAPYVWVDGNNVSYTESGIYEYSYKKQDENGSWYVVTMILELKILTEDDSDTESDSDSDTDTDTDIEPTPEPEVRPQPLPEYVKLNPMKFFTPNGDGINEKWLVEGLENYPDAEVEIYDRFQRRLLKVKGKDFTGWDGYYNGRPMPTDDYWFLIITYGYNETITGHFLLKN